MCSSDLGEVRIKKRFLYHYLNIKEGSLYSKEKLKWVDKKITELPYLKSLQSSDLMMLGTGANMNLYLKSKKSSQFNFLIGLQPASSINNKVQFTGDLNLDLKNSFGYGENIQLKWQQLQPKSPRLNLGYTKPYLFNSLFNAEAGFELFKKDSSFLLLTLIGHPVIAHLLFCVTSSRSLMNTSVKSNSNFLTTLLRFTSFK